MPPQEGDEAYKISEDGGGCCTLEPQSPRLSRIRQFLCNFVCLSAVSVIWLLINRCSEVVEFMLLQPVYVRVQYVGPQQYR